MAGRSLVYCEQIRMLGCCGRTSKLLTRFDGVQGIMVSRNPAVGGVNVKLTSNVDEVPLWVQRQVEWMNGWMVGSNAPQPQLQQLHFFSSSASHATEQQKMEYVTYININKYLKYL